MFDSCAISVGVAYWVPTRRSRNLIYFQAIYELKHTQIVHKPAKKCVTPAKIHCLVLAWLPLYHVKENPKSLMSLTTHISLL